VWDNRLDAPAVMKILDRTLLQTAAEERFWREASLTARLQQLDVSPYGVWGLAGNVRDLT
jgi:hypothetical protein